MACEPPYEAIVNGREVADHNGVRLPACLLPTPVSPFQLPQRAVAMEYFRWFIQQVQRVGQARRRIGRQGHALNPNAGQAYRTDLKVRWKGKAEIEQALHLHEYVGRLRLTKVQRPGENHLRRCETGWMGWVKTFSKKLSNRSRSKNSFGR